MSKTESSAIPMLIEGGIVVDDRGQIAFVNDFHFERVKRFYLVSNHRERFVRAWHAHRKEGKYMTVVQGAAVLAAVPIDDWDRPSKDAKVSRYVLSEHKPAVLYIPPGYANGLMSLTRDSKIIVFSTATLEESQGDDIRYDARYWDPWQVIER